MGDTPSYLYTVHVTDQDTTYDLGEHRFANPLQQDHRVRIPPNPHGIDRNAKAPTTGMVMGIEHIAQNGYDAAYSIAYVKADAQDLAKVFKSDS